MGNIPRLNKTIIPALADPSAIGRAGGLARGIETIAGVGTQILQEQQVFCN